MATAPGHADLRRKNDLHLFPNGPLACLIATKGNIVWSIDILNEFGGKKIY